MTKKINSRNGDDKTIKRLSQVFKGMKERMKNPKNDFLKTAELFKESLYEAYIIDDINLNNKVIDAYREITEVLQNKIHQCKSEEERKKIYRFLFELDAIMVTFYDQAGKHYN